MGKLGKKGPIPNISDGLAFSLTYLEQQAAGEESLAERSACGLSHVPGAPALTAGGLGAHPLFFPMAFSYFAKSLDFCQGGILCFNLEIKFLLFQWVDVGNLNVCSCGVLWIIQGASGHSRQKQSLNLQNIYKMQNLRNWGFEETVSGHVR